MMKLQRIFVITLLMFSVSACQHIGLDAKRYNVYFDFGSSTLNQEARATINKAAKAFGSEATERDDWDHYRDQNNIYRTGAKTGGYTHIKVIGHTDTVGSAAANKALSQRRANAVKHALSNKGVSASVISTKAKGESRLAVSSGDNVKEQKNRRVTIKLY